MTRVGRTGVKTSDSSSGAAVRAQLSPRAAWILCCLSVLGAYLLSGCASRKTAARGSPPPSGQPSVGRGEATEHGAEARPTGSLEEGYASWYGAPFHGRRASNGELYDMHKFTAAHRTLPFNTVVRVTNLQNGRSAVVRINDRGPFVENRIIDLSFAAAREMDAIGPGVVPVRLEILDRKSVV